MEQTAGPNGKYDITIKEEMYAAECEAFEKLLAESEDTYESEKYHE